MIAPVSSETHKIMGALCPHLQRKGCRGTQAMVFLLSPTLKMETTGEQ